MPEINLTQILFENYKYLPLITWLSYNQQKDAYKKVNLDILNKTTRPIDCIG